MKILLILLTAFVAVTSTVSGILMIADPTGSIFQFEQAVLNGTPFSDFMVPGVVLFVLVGGTNSVAAFYLLRHKSSWYIWSLIGGIMISGWTTVQIMMIGMIHWLQVVYIIIGILIILTSLQLKGKWVA